MRISLRRGKLGDTHDASVGSDLERLGSLGAYAYSYACNRKRKKASQATIKGSKRETNPPPQLL